MHPTTSTGMKRRVIQCKILKSTVKVKPLHYGAKVIQDHVVELSEVDDPLIGEGTPLEAFANRLKVLLMIQSKLYQSSRLTHVVDTLLDDRG